MEQTECSETSAYKIQTAGNYPEESIQQCVSFISKMDLINSGTKMMWIKYYYL